MFCVVDFCEDGAQPPAAKRRLLSFSKRRRRFENEPLSLSRVKPEGLPPFHLLSLPERRLLSDEAMGVYAAYRHKLLFPVNADLPDAVKPFLFMPSRFSRERMCLLTDKTLSELPKKARLNAVFVRDGGFVSSKALLPHLSKISRVFILTGCDDRFEAFSTEALVRYGAVVYRGSSMPVQSRYDLLIDIDGGVIYTAFGQKNGALTPLPVKLPENLLTVIPPGCDGDMLAAAMFEICGVMLDNG